MFILLHPDDFVVGFGRWLDWHYKERGVFSSWAMVWHMHSTNTGHFECASI